LKIEIKSGLKTRPPGTDHAARHGPKPKGQAKPKSLQKNNAGTVINPPNQSRTMPLQITENIDQKEKAGKEWGFFLIRLVRGG
jgi:hypothetical protein